MRQAVTVKTTALTVSVSTHRKQKMTVTSEMRRLLQLSRTRHQSHTLYLRTGLQVTICKIVAQETE